MTQRDHLNADEATIRTLRDEYARARSLEDLDRAERRALSLITANDPYIAAKARAALSLYSFLRGKEPEEAMSILNEASQPDDASEESLRAFVTLAIARHRLARNESSAKHSRHEQDVLRQFLPKLRDINAHAEELCEWHMEQTHFHRYIGDWRQALQGYCEQDDLQWHPVGKSYQRVIQSHYLVSTACDWLEVMTLPREYDSGNPLLGNLASSLLDVFAREAETMPEFPMFQGHQAKHQALCFAILGEEHAARTELSRAQAIFKSLGQKKGLLLSQQFLALVDARFGHTASAIKGLHEVQTRAQTYYPRCAHTSMLHLGRLLLIDKQPGASLRFLTDLSGTSALQNKVVVTAARAMASEIDKAIHAGTATGAAGIERCIRAPIDTVDDEFASFEKMWESTVASTLLLSEQNPPTVRAWLVKQESPAGSTSTQGIGHSADLDAKTSGDMSVTTTLSLERMSVRARAQATHSELVSPYLHKATWAAMGAVLGFVSSNLIHIPSLVATFCGAATLCVIALLWDIPLYLEIRRHRTSVTSES